VPSPCEVPADLFCTPDVADAVKAATADGEDSSWSRARITDIEESISSSEIKAKVSTSTASI